METFNYPTSGIVTDAAHSTKKGLTEYQGLDLTTGEKVFYESLGDQTTNIGEFLAVIDGLKYIIETNYEPKVLYTDSMVAITWVKNKSTGSKKEHHLLKKAEVFLKIMESKINQIQIIHWDSKKWGESPADFGNK